MKEQEKLVKTIQIKKRNQIDISKEKIKAVELCLKKTDLSSYQEHVFFPQRCQNKDPFERLTNYFTTQ